MLDRASRAIAKLMASIELAKNRYTLFGGESNGSVFQALKPTGEQ